MNTGVPREPRTSDSVTTLQTPLKEFRKLVIGGRVKARDRVFSDPQRLFPDTR